MDKERLRSGDRAVVRFRSVLGNLILKTRLKGFEFRIEAFAGSE